MISVLLVDDDADLLTLLSIRVDLEPDLRVIGTASDGSSAVLECLRLLPDVVVVDLLMPGTDGYEAIDRLRNEAPDTGIVAYSSDVSPFSERMMRKQGVPLIAKEGDSAPLMDVIRRVAAGEL